MVHYIEDSAYVFGIKPQMEQGKPAYVNIIEPAGRVKYYLNSSSRRIRLNLDFILNGDSNKGFRVETSVNLNKLYNIFEENNHFLVKELLSKSLEDIKEEIFKYMKSMWDNTLDAIKNGIGAETLKKFGVEATEERENGKFVKGTITYNGKTEIYNQFSKFQKRAKEILAEILTHNFYAWKIIESVYKKVSSEYEKVEKKLEEIKSLKDHLKKSLNGKNIDYSPKTLREWRKELGLPTKILPYKYVRYLFKRTYEKKGRYYKYILRNQDINKIFSDLESLLEEEKKKLKVKFLGYFMMLSSLDLVYYASNPEDGLEGLSNIFRDVLKNVKATTKDGSFTLPELLVAMRMGKDIYDNNKKPHKKLKTVLNILYKTIKKDKIVKRRLKRAIQSVSKNKKLNGFISNESQMNDFLRQLIISITPSLFWNDNGNYFEKILDGEDDWNRYLEVGKSTNIAHSFVIPRNIGIGHYLGDSYIMRAYFKKVLDEIKIIPIAGISEIDKRILTTLKSQFPLNVPQNVPVPQPPAQPV